MRINNNTTSFSVWSNYSTNVRGLQASMSRLSTGVISSKDDPAGVGISERMRAQIDSTSMAIQNTDNSLSMLQTADGWLQKINDMLSRMKSLTIEANGGLSEGDIANCQVEFEALQQEITRVTSHDSCAAQFNGLALFRGGDGNTKVDGELDTIDQSAKINVQIGSDVNQDINIDLPNLDITNSENIGQVVAYKYDGTQIDTTYNEDGYVNGVLKKSVTWTNIINSDCKDSERVDVYDATAANVKQGDDISAGDKEFWYVGTDGLTTNLAFGGETVSTSDFASMTVGAGQKFKDSASAEVTLTTVKAAFDAVDGQSDLTAIAGKLDEFKDIFADGAVDITVGGKTISLADGDSLYSAITGVGIKGLTTPAVADSAMISTASTTNASGAAVSWDQNSKNVKAFGQHLAALSSATQGMTDAEAEAALGSGDNVVFFKQENYDTASAKGGIRVDDPSAMAMIDYAIDFVSKATAGLAAQQKRIEYTRDSLVTYQDNLQSAESQIRDIDMAEESTTLAKYQVLTQASNAMLAQANSMSQNVLSLLQ